ncbi:DMT family transporter [Saccharopolyspora sp. K220]|uniref:DMT family transporter n=1 Tax=Saccharopolyspora soli TaxID=2926618 RepID=UPI001F5A2090|nr:DMT family transporter [Saccharopolyspora soli]MCI2416267.1 DMT family transporter [Saccharopolyspora soli]
MAKQVADVSARGTGQVTWLPGFVLLSAIWGSSFVLIRVAVDAGVAPLWVALARCLFGAAALCGVCAVQRASMPRDLRTWGHAAVVGLLLNAAPFTLFAYGETHVSSVLAGVWNATTPLTTLVFVLLLVPQENPTVRRMIGLLIGFGGVLVVLGVWHGVGGGVLVGSLACLGATTCYGAGFAYTRRFFSGRTESAAALTTMQLTCATAQLALGAVLFGSVPEWPGVTAVGSLVLLGAVGTGLAFLLNLRVIRAAGSTIASTVTYVTPLWSTALGAILLAEPVGWNTVLGGALVIAGVLFARSAR